MKKMFGVFVKTSENGSVVTDKVNRYDSYEEMVNDSNPGKYGIVDNVVYHKTDDGWVVGFENASAAGKVNDYTAFEVFATNKVIPAGTIDDQAGVGDLLGIEGYVGTTIEEDGVVKPAVYSREVPIGMIHQFLLRGSTPKEDQDVVVDWGDGETDSLKNVVPDSAKLTEIDEDTGEATSPYASSSYPTVYCMTHEYAKPGKYIVRIFGSTYQHIQYDEEAKDENGTKVGKDRNLICRIFDADLPIRSDITNLDHLCTYAYRLLNVNIGGAAAKVFMNAFNLSSIFSYCENLLYATGFNKYARYVIAPSVFYRCYNLLYTDFIVPSTVNSITGLFVQCGKLKLDIAKLLGNNAAEFFDCPQVSVRRAFYGCGIDTDAFIANIDTIASKLWNNKTNDILFDGDTPVFAKPYVKSSATKEEKNAATAVFKEISDRIPSSWGGIDLVAGIECDLDRMKVDRSSCTAFEVMPNKKAIPAETIDNQEGIGKLMGIEGYVGTTIEKEDGEVKPAVYSIEVPACTVHKMSLKSLQAPANCDVVIDWGDGKIDRIKDEKYDASTTVEYNVAGEVYTISHDYNYKNAMAFNSQKYIVRVFGKDYYSIRHNESNGNNLMSRIFENDLPVADHITNLASFAAYATRLLKVKLGHSTDVFIKAYNWSSVVDSCSNLISFTGFKKNVLRHNCIITSLFHECVSLEETDFVIPQGVSAIGSVFENCGKLAKKIEDLIPAGGFSSKSIILYQTFWKAGALIGDVPTKYLFGDPNITWVINGTNLPFADCNADIRKQVPVSWGGTKAE